MILLSIWGYCHCSHKALKARIANGESVQFEGQNVVEFEVDCEESFFWHSGITLALFFFLFQLCPEKRDLQVVWSRISMRPIIELRWCTVIQLTCNLNFPTDHCYVTGSEYDSFYPSLYLLNRNNVICFTFLSTLGSRAKRHLFTVEVWTDKWRNDWKT